MAGYITFIFEIPIMNTFSDSFIAKFNQHGAGFGGNS
jgi:hypothetical protein